MKQMRNQMNEENGKAALVGLQHLLAMYAGAVAVPLLIGTGLGMDAQQMTYLISMDIFMCGLATLLQLTVTKYFGIGLPVILGCAIQVVGPAIMIGSQAGIGAVFGSIIVAGLFLMVTAGIFSKIKVLFPTIVTGTVITVIGLTLIPVAIGKMGGGDVSMSNFGEPRYLLQAFVTIALIIGIQAFGRGFIRSIAVLIGLAGGTLLAYFMGDVNFSAISQAPVFQVPHPFYFGMPTFDIVSIILMIIIVIVCMVESTGVYFALGEITEQEVTGEDLKRGYRTEGLAILLGGIFNTFPHTGFSQNVGLVQLSGIKTRLPIYFAAIFLIILGLFPKIGALAQVIPEAVLGGGMLVMFGMVAVAGMRMLSKVDYNNDKNLLIVAVSIGFGLGFNMIPQLFDRLPETLQLFTSNGIVMSSLTAVVLNLVLNGLKTKE
ncbi:xanthine permease [Enterococcus saccharolyticus subsp. saccharolyticus ATCC 43076]|uniref:Xanthine permease n=2 Tax=Enterococcus saccharolyticus TaxID=41997 RepID=S0JRZ6_9ENTE|nr:xanthine permease [Enterococcus saccharolyticus subsp. saccharolyticus ATCC 43076]EOT80871.1 xanthine permease [Enterococcus saccharolyticus subsp. saccharolyticus ATCC 43076]